MDDVIQPGTDLKSTALAIAARVCKYGDYDDKGNLARTTKEHAVEKAKLIASVARELLQGVDENP